MRKGVSKYKAGMKFNFLTLVKNVTKDGKSVKWLCRCDCGKEKEIFLTSVSSGSTKSCGCMRSKLKYGDNLHNYSKTRLHNVWSHMKRRCNNVKNPSYHRYGGRGIKVCKEWHRFKPFMEWALNNGYSDKLQIDRIDNNDGYYPENCRFVTARKNSQNRRSNRNITYKGKTFCINEASRRYGIKRQTLAQRLDNGWSVEKAIETPVMSARS